MVTLPKDSLYLQCAFPKQEIRPKKKAKELIGENAVKLLGTRPLKKKKLGCFSLGEHVWLRSDYS